MTAMPRGVIEDEIHARGDASRFRAPPRVAADPTARHFLFLRGPFGPFFARVGGAMRHAGARVSKIVFDGGDHSDWGFGNGRMIYRDSEAAWPAWIDRFLIEEGVTDLVLFNDCIEPHQMAIIAARRRGLNVHVFEEGYFRPRWITLEPNGVNAYSSCPRDPEHYRAVSSPGDGGVPAEDVGKPTRFLILNAIWHYTAKVFTQGFYPKRKNPFALPVFDQIVGSILRYAKNKVETPATTAKVERLINGGAPFFLALFQRAGDSQLWKHSSYTNESFAAEVIESFAAHAPAEALLVFKLHPLDPGLVNYARAVEAEAARRDVARRVVFLDGGALNALAHKARGAITINSTAGLATIGFSCPTKVLGRAVYDIEGLTDRKPLSRFWLDPKAPDHELFRRFRHAVMQRTQINGSFFTPKGIHMAVPEVVRRLLAAG